MKRIFSILLCVLLYCTAASAQELSALFNYNVYYLPDEDKCYVETYLSIDAWTMNYLQDEKGQWHATAEVVLLARQGDEVVFVKKYDLNSPVVTDTNALGFNFIDLQRFYLEKTSSSNEYTLELNLRDKYSDDDAAVVTENFVVAYTKDKPAMSDLQLIATFKPTTEPNVFSRNGYDMEPYVDNFLPNEMSQVALYFEVYNIQKELGKEPFVSRIYIEDQATGRMVPGTEQNRRHNADEMVPILCSIDLTSLPSGNFNIVAELRNRNNDVLLYDRLPVMRSNASVNAIDSLPPDAASFAFMIKDEATLNYYLDALYPIASGQEIDAVKEMLTRKGDKAMEEKQVFFSQFWTSRYGLQAESKWMEYKSWMEYVDKNFSYPKTRGYRTDRGRVYLQYGPPDFVRDEKNFVSVRLGAGDSPSTNNRLTRPETPSLESQGQIHYLPYILWRYNKLDKDDANRVFLFWDDMRSGFYRLLVSNARGEVWEEGWERRLSQNQLQEGAVGEVGEQFAKGH